MNAEAGPKAGSVTQGQRSITPASGATARRRQRFRRRSALIDRFTVQLEAATDPATRRAFEQALRNLEAYMPPGERL